jgi:hypothetical protein
VSLGFLVPIIKLAVLITIFIQIFRLAAEPFFFNQSGKDDARKIYARVMKFFVIACCFMFLVIALFLDFWKVLIASKFKEYAEGINIVPVLAMASVFLGIYYNLSIWYKLTNKNMFGAYITYCRCSDHIVAEYMVYTLIRVYRCRVGHVYLLCLHDGGELFTGSKTLRDTLPEEKTDCLSRL